MKSESPFKVRQVVRPRVQVEEQLKEAILLGHFAQGEKLPPETALAAQFGVSRPTIREALGGCDRWSDPARSQGWPGKLREQRQHAIVEPYAAGVGRHHLAPRDPAHRRAHRGDLEIPAARWAAERRTDAQLAQLRVIVDGQSATTLDDPEIPNVDLAFHALIGWSGVRQPVAGRVHRGRPWGDSSGGYLEATAKTARATVKQHMAVLKGLEAADADDAAEAMEVHLDGFCRLLHGLPAPEDRPTVRRPSRENRLDVISSAALRARIVRGNSSRYGTMDKFARRSQERAWCSPAVRFSLRRGAYRCRCPVRGHQIMSMLLSSMGARGVLVGLDHVRRSPPGQAMILDGDGRRLCGARQATSRSPACSPQRRRPRPPPG